MKPVLKSPIRPDYRIAVAMGVIVAIFAHFGLFNIPTSYITREGCIEAGGQVKDSKCILNQIELDIRP